MLQTQVHRSLSAALYSATKPNRRCRIQSVTRAQGSATATNTAGLEAWITSEGLDATKRSVTTSPTGLVAAKPVAKGEVCLTIPERLWITYDTVVKSSFGPLVAELEPWLAIALFLLHERSQPDSPWQPYLQSIPEDSNSPVAWTEEELDYLRGTQLLTTVQGYRAYFRQRYVDLTTTLFPQHPDVFNAETFSYPNFVWAACTVRSRVHAPLEGENIAMVPIADMVTHRRKANVKRVLKAAGLFGGGQSLALEAESALFQGAALAADFGPTRTDGQLLLDYGVIDNESTGPSFALTISLPEDDRFYDDKLDVLESNGLLPVMEFILDTDGRPSTDLLAALRLVNLSGGDSFLLESIFRNEVWGHMQGPVSEPNERAVYQSMIEGCKASLAGYPSTIDEDLMLIKTLEAGSREYCAVQVRLGEKEALDAALLLFEQRMERLADLEYYGERRLKRLGLLDKEGKSTWEGFFDEGIA